MNRAVRAIALLLYGLLLTCMGPPLHESIHVIQVWAEGCTPSVEYVGCSGDPTAAACVSVECPDEAHHLLHESRLLWNELVAFGGGFVVFFSVAKLLL